MKLIFSLLLILLTALSGSAQKTVHVREYRRKDGTVVKAHDRRPPRSTTSSTTNPPSQVGFHDQKFEPSPLDELSRLVLEPYTTVDLGEGSFYTPGGTGTTRPRRVTCRTKGC